MKPASAPSALKVQAALGPRFTALEFDVGTRTAEDAARAIGCTVAEIAKSLVFRAESGRSVLVIASGVNRVDETMAAAIVGERIGRADADFVRAATGFAIGGVPPVVPLSSRRRVPTAFQLSMGEAPAEGTGGAVSDATAAGGAVGGATAAAAAAGV